jgi:hypothetical protein
MFQNKAKIFKATLLAALLTLSIVSIALAADYWSVSFPHLNNVTGKVTGESARSYNTALFKLTKDSDTMWGYCTDIKNQTTSGTQYKPSDEPVSCQVLYVIHDAEYGPKDQASMNKGKVEVGQSAVWHYSDSFDITDPTSINQNGKTFADYTDLVNNVDANAQAWCSAADVANFDFVMVRTGNCQYVIKVLNAPGGNLAGYQFDIFADGSKIGTTDPTNAEGLVFYSDGTCTNPEDLKARITVDIPDGNKGGLVMVDKDDSPKQKVVVPTQGGKVILERMPEEPTLISLQSMDAVGGYGRATINWETASELQNAGFNLYRAPSADGPWEQVNGDLIPGQGNSQFGWSYSFADAPGFGRYFYMLEDVETTGITTLHDPVEVSVSPAFLAPFFRPVAP